MNTVHLLGKVTGVPDYAVLDKGARQLDFTLAIQRPSKRRGGAGADFIRCRMWNKLAEDWADITTGDVLACVGRLRNDGGSVVVSVHDLWRVGP